MIFKVGDRVIGNGIEGDIDPFEKEISIHLKEKYGNT